jgi:hypothetical protein
MNQHDEWEGMGKTDADYWDEADREDTRIFFRAIFAMFTLIVVVAVALCVMTSIPGVLR